MKARIVVAALVAARVAGAAPARACDDQAPERYRSTRTVWCVNPGIWASHQADVEAFFPYGDQIIGKLEELFAITPNDLPYTIEVMEPNGYAQTPSHYGPGVAVTGDAFYSDYAGVPGFWGKLLVLHELVNQWTGLVTGGWPTDWWADHRSPFPNAMDEQIMRATGQTAAADAQHARFADPQSGSYDPEVAMFDDLYDAHGFAGLRRAFELIRADGLGWGELRDPPAYAQQTAFVSGNPSALLSNYVTAYLSLGAGEDLTAKFLAKTVGQQPPGWTDPWQDTSPSSPVVTAIASAHCSLQAAAAAGADVAAARASLRKGDYAAAARPATSSCGANCPGECGCKTSGDCVAPWIADAVPPRPIDAGLPLPGPPDARPAGGADGVSGGCGCRSGGAPASVTPILLALLALRRRR